jgi:hypothetical protein
MHKNKTKFCEKFYTAKQEENEKSLAMPGKCVYNERCCDIDSDEA